MADKLMQPREYLFVYGTLRTTEGHPLHNYLRGLSDFVGPATIGGIKIELEGGYPGLLISNNVDEKVTGELYCLHEGKAHELFDVLDRYEACHEDDPEPHEYFRHRRDVTLLADNSIYSAWVYIYNG